MSTIDGDRAPELSVRAVSAGDASLARLVAGGAGLLLFVSEECPTSALALRRLGPLVEAWAGAGLRAVAVFEDPFEVATRTARRLGWMGPAVSEE